MLLRLPYALNTIKGRGFGSIEMDQGCQHRSPVNTSTGADLGNFPSQNIMEKIIRALPVKLKPEIR